jgi:hypothetical protein
MGSRTEQWLGRRVTPLEDIPEAARETVAGQWHRAMQDDDTQAILREVFTPFIDELPEQSRWLIEASFYERLTEQQMAEKLEVDRSVVSRRRDTALRLLVRQLALTDPDFRAYDASLHTGRKGRPPRDYDAESDAAWRVLSALLASRR